MPEVIKQGLLAISWSVRQMQVYLRWVLTCLL